MPLPAKTSAQKRKIEPDSSLDAVNPKRLRRNDVFHVKPSAVAVIQGIEQAVSSSQLHYNQIAGLIQYAKTPDDQDLSAAATSALCRIFSRFLAAGTLSIKGRSTKEDVIISQWLQGRYFEFEEFLFDSLATANHKGQILVVDTLMHLAREDSLCSDTDLVNRRVFIFRVIEILIKDDNFHDLRLEFVQKFVDPYEDVKAYTFDAISKIIIPECGEHQIDAVIAILTSISAISQSKNGELRLYFRASGVKDSNSYWAKATAKHAMAAWINVFNYPLSKAQRKLLLGLVVPKISLWVPQIELLIDFLTDSFNLEGSTSLLALSGLFHLIQEKNLDYPRFYEKMYSMLDDTVLHSKYRSRFFRLLVKCLESTHLPAALVASFIKRLSQIALHSSPSGTITVIPLIYNLLSDHPPTTFMIHREENNSRSGLRFEEEALHEPFLADEIDPMKTCAEQSSIWEIKSLQSHYHPSVAMVARIISEPFFKRAYSTEDFMDHSYETMIDANLKKEIKRPPVVEFEISKRIFTSDTPPDRVGTSEASLRSLWRFS